MKKTLIAALLALAPTALAADPALGIWQTEVDDGSFALIDVHMCGQKICGTISRTFYADGREYQSPNIGRDIAIDMVPDGEGRYFGRGWQPSKDRFFKNGRMVLNGDKLELEGCVAKNFICVGQTWTRLQ